MKPDQKTSGDQDEARSTCDRIVYVLERFPADTLNFVYNEIDVLEQQGFSIDIYSLLPSIYCPADAEKYLQRTRAVKPAPLHLLLWALLYYMVRRPLELLKLLVKMPLNNNVDFWHKFPRTVSHVVYGVYFAYLVRARADHVHAHFAHKAATAAYCASKLNGSSFSFTAHGSATIYPPSQYSLPSKIRGALFVVAISEYNRRMILDICPDVSPERIVVNRTGILIPRFSYAMEEKNTTGVPQVLSVASLYAIKNHEGMLAAFGLLAAAGVSFHLHLVGKDDDGRWPGLLAQAESLHIAERVTFHGVADHGTIAEKLREADLAILTSHSEGIPVAMMEAMATGTPVMGPRVTGVPELVTEGVTGWLADPACPQECAEILERVFSDQKILNSVRLAARKKVETDFDMNANANKLANIFRTRISRLN